MSKKGAKIWSQEERYEIYDMVKTSSVSEMAKHFHVPYAKMIDKIHKMGLNSKNERQISWSPEEDAILQECYADAPKDYIMEKLPHRNWSAIRQRGKGKFNLIRKSRDHIYLNYRFFDEWTEESAYAYGFILADGYVHRANTAAKGNKNILQIEVGIKDIDIIYKLAAAIQFRGSIVNYGKSVKISMNNAHLIDELVKKGMPLENKTFNATFPENVPSNMIRHVIRGLIDGDGWSTIMKNHRDKDMYVLGFCGTQSLVSSVKDLFPVDCSGRKVQREAKNCWGFSITGKKAYEVGKWLYSDSSIYLARKKKQLDAAKYIYDMSLTAPSYGKPCEDMA